MASSLVTSLRKLLKVSKKSVQRLIAALQKPKADVNTIAQQIIDECHKLVQYQADLNALVNMQTEEAVLSKAARRLGKRKLVPKPVDAEVFVCDRCAHSKAEHDRHGCGHTDRVDTLITGCDCIEYTPKDLEGIRLDE